LSAFVWRCARHELPLRLLRFAGANSARKKWDALAKSSPWGTRNPIEVRAAGHTPSGASRHLPQHGWGRKRAPREMYEYGRRRRGAARSAG
jgi:hypothetical protein